MSTVSIGRNDTRAEKLCVGPLPGRKRESLYKISNGTITTLATFKDDEGAEWAKAFLFRLAALEETGEPSGWAKTAPTQEGWYE